MRFYLFALATLVFATPATAQIPNETIRAYNEAVQAGDPAIIIRAAEALAETAIANPENEAAGALAFEAAWAMCQINECNNASEAARFAAANISGPADAYPSADTRNVLTSFVNWKADDSTDNREMLVTRLGELAPDDVSRVSITAHREHFLYCANKGAWKDASKAATAAADHIATFKNEIFDDYAFAELARITAGFNSNPKLDQYRDILVFTSELKAHTAQILESTPDANIEFLTTFGFKADAWANAIGAYFNSTRRGRAVERLLAEFSSPQEPDPTNFCPGSFDEPPRVEYPQDAANDGHFGSVIMGFSINHGKLENVEVLAAVPEGIFEEEVIRSMERLNWSPEEGVDTSTCSLVRDNVVYPFTFQINQR